MKDAVRMQCPEGMTGVSWNGIGFDADDNGVVEVPKGAVVDLANHGLVELSDDAEVAEEQAATVRKRGRK